MKSNRPDTKFTGSDVCALSAREVVRLLRNGKISPAELIIASKTRTEQVNGDVNAIVTTCFDRARGKVSTVANSSDEAGWLAGLPIGIKDLSAVEGVRTTMGTPGLAENIPVVNDAIVDILEARGGLVVGKTNTPEMGAGGNTFNAVFGATRNPWDTRKNAGGSSGGGGGFCCYG